MSRGRRVHLKKFIVWMLFLCSIFPCQATAQASWLDCYGGYDPYHSPTWWYLLDYHGYPLEDGDWVYPAWTGPDGEIDPPDGFGYPTDDDSLLRDDGRIEYGMFYITATIWDTMISHPMTGDFVYLRIFDGPKESIGPGNYYADSQLHEVEWTYPGYHILCVFPGDPGGGHTDTPIFSGPLNDFTIHGGLDTTGLSYWPLMDVHGQQLQDGDLVQLIGVGSDSQINPLDEVTGLPTGDDSLLTTWGVGHGYEEAETGLFKYEAFTLETEHWPGRLTQGDCIYLRIFNDSTLGEGSGSKWYGESPTYEVQFESNEEFYSFSDSSFDAIFQVPWYRRLTIHGGLDSSMAEHPLTDYFGVKLEDGDLVQLIWAGSDGSVDDINEIDGMPTGDDGLLTSLAIGAGYGAETGLFWIELQTYSSHGLGMPAAGDILYLRVFNDSSAELATYYGESEAYIVSHQPAELFFSFPDDADDAVCPLHQTITIYGGTDSSMAEHPLTDSSGVRLEDGDVVQLIWAGPGGIVDPIDERDGMPSGDDSVLISSAVGTGYGEETGLFKVELPTFSSHDWGMPASGDVLYLRVFNDASIGAATYYGESEIYVVTNQVGEIFFSFPDDADDAVYPLHQTITIYGGTDSSMAEHPLTDSSGVRLEDGDVVQLIWTGPDGEIDPISESSGMPTGDDDLVTSSTIGTGYGDGTGLFKIELPTYSSHQWGMPAAVDVLYLRVFNHHIIKYASHYGESDVHMVRNDHEESFFPFSDDANDCIIPNPSLTSVEEWADQVGSLPAEYVLLQNHPNPFNAFTEIQYGVPAGAHVSLKVYNIRASEVVTLVDDYREGGYYTVRWNAGDLASGVYFCRLRAGNFSETVKMVLLR